MAEKKICLENGSSFEQALERLEGIVGQLEDGEVGLAEALAAYEEGVKHLRQCYQLLEAAERRIELLTGVDASGNSVCQPFDDEATAALDPKSGGRSRRRSASEKQRPPIKAESDVDDAARLF